MEITRRIVFHAGHMLKDDNSKCYHPHGHEYVLECTITGRVHTGGPENGMVMNFGDLKDYMMKFVHDRVDHKFILEKTDPRAIDFRTAVGDAGIYFVDFPPTAENLVVYFYKRIHNELPGGIKITNLRLQETYQCWVEYAGS
jgi:6-pyruvoyltetrahydropterin/6-carboxytetrahydropterin synthase